MKQIRMPSSGQVNCPTGGECMGRPFGAWEVEIHEGIRRPFVLQPSQRGKVPEADSVAPSQGRCEGGRICFSITPEADEGIRIWLGPHRSRQSPRLTKAYESASVAGIRRRRIWLRGRRPQGRRRRRICLRPQVTGLSYQHRLPFLHHPSRYRRLYEGHTNRFLNFQDTSPEPVITIQHYQV